MSHVRRFATTRAPIALVTLNAFLCALVPARPVLAQDVETERRQPPALEAEVAPAGQDAADSRSTEVDGTRVEPEASHSEGLQVMAAAGGGGGATGNALSLPQGAATVGGMGDAFSALLSTGTASYKVPIPLMQARGLAQPSLTLSYTSDAGDGVLGVGWSLGVPFIARDTSQGPPSYQSVLGVGGDRFVYNGAEIVPICSVSASAVCAGAQSGETMPSWSGGWTYFRPRLEGSFQRLFWSPDHRTWRLQDRSGLQAEFGAPLDSSGDVSAIESAPGDATRIFRWNIARQYDTNGSGNPLGDANPQAYNIVAYRYASSGGLAYPSDVYDTPPATGAASAPLLSSYAHHTHLDWQARPDVLTTYRRGWAVTQAQRLAGIDITSEPFVGGAASRLLVRRIHLAYDPTYHVSLLTSVQEEGRCSGTETSGVPAEQSDGTLPATACATLPPLTLAYTHVTSATGAALPPTTAGNEPLNQSVRALSNSPSLSPGDGYTGFFDANADGLPDVLYTNSATTLSPGNHALYLNGAGGASDHLGSLLPLSLSASSTGINIGSLSFANGNVLPLDLDGNGLADLAYLAPASAPQVFSAQVGAASASWIRQTPVSSASLFTTLNLAAERGRVNTVDVNGDGAVDVVYTTDTGIQTYLSLSPWLGGNGAFGSAAVSSLGVALSSSPLLACVPTASTPITFNDPNVRVADMNGDGLADLVRIHNGEVLYWPGRGDGHWGTEALGGCLSGQAVSGNDVAMTGAPLLASLNGLQLADVNGDGLADLVQVASTSVIVWLNTNGAGFAASASIASPGVEASLQHVQLLDINGSGTADVVWADSGNYRYVDLLGGARPWLLAHVANGYGKTTDIAYGTSASEMLSAAASGRPWGSTIPLVVPVVKTVTVKDHLDVAGRTAGSYVTTYSYRDPAYDGRRRDFRGFRDAVTTVVGDANEPTSVTESHFLTGDCVDEDSSGRCGINARALDNLRDALDGLVTSVDTRDANGVALSTTHTTYRLRQLYVSLDGREVRHAFPSVVDTYRYDTEAFVSSPQSVSLPDVEVERTPGKITDDPPTTVTLAAAAGRTHVASSSQVDTFGNPLATVQSGCVEGCSPVDEVITITVVPQQLGGSSGWIWRPVESWVTGSASPTQKRNHEHFSYDSLGRPLGVTADLVGSLPLARSNATGSVAPSPPSASKDGAVAVSSFAYDAFGNVTSAASAGASCASTEFDPTYAQLPVVSTTYVGLAASNGCGQTQLVTTAQYDRGLTAVTSRTGPNGEVGKADYDQLGRVVDEYAPDPVNVGQLAAAPSATYQYFPTANGVTQPWSLVHATTQAGASTGATPTHESWVYVDGLGRKLARLEQADPRAGDGGSWLVTDFVDFDVKASVLHQYRPWFWSGSPQSLSLATAPTSAEWTRRDAFGRGTDSYALDGSWSEHAVYHAASRDQWDAGHLGSQPGSSYTTTTVDGHGRSISSTQRFASGQVIDSRTVQTAYLPTGEPTVITRTHGTGSDAPVVRWMQYDTLGRLVLNVEPDTTVGFRADPTTSPSAMSTIRNAYDDAGRLVGTSDARGCGENFYYDAGGRLVAEDYSPCAAGQSAYSVPNLTTGDGTEAFYRYDASDPEGAAIAAAGCPASETTRGRLISISSRGAKDVVGFDGRGRATCSARKLAVPGAPVSALAGRYAARWYARSAGYDAADRIVSSTTGARSPELLAGGASAVSLAYAASGAPTTVNSSYGPLVRSLIHDADGGPLTIAYGDVASTTTQYTYDARHRLSTVYTGRSAPAIWSKPPVGYTPPSSPATTQQLVLENGTFAYDEASNPIEIQDLRAPTEWPAGAKPVSRAIGYDDLYRVASVQYSYTGGTDPWTSPFEAEVTGATSTEADAQPSPHVEFDGRVLEESFTFDWKGNAVASDDDAHGFYDRSLGTIANGAAVAGPYQLVGASNRGVTGVTSRAGDLAAAYDAAGELTALVIHRDGPCLPSTSSCWQRFAYAWDEVGHLSDARRWDLAGTERTNASTLAQAPPARAPNIELAYGYTQSGDRTLKTAIDPYGNQSQTAYVFPSLELHRTSFDTQAGDYVLNAGVETPYLSGIGRTLARVVYATTSAPTATSGRLHVFLELPDHLGSSTIVIDHDTSELVERGTYTAFGKEESDYRPDRWGDFREEKRFTGKEDDIEVGLHYFGARYYSAPLGRWASPDPLALHSPGAEDDNLYAYGRGRVFMGTDPDGRIFPLIVLGICLLVGALIGAGVNAAVQGVLISQGKQKEFEWGSFWISTAAGGAAGLTGGAGGLAAGAIAGEAGLTFGAKLATDAAISVCSSIAGGATARGLTKGESAASAGGLLTDTIVGLVTFGLDRLLAPMFRGAAPQASGAMSKAADDVASSAPAGAPAPGGAGLSGEPVVPSAFPANDNGRPNSVLVNTTASNDGLAQAANDNNGVPADADRIMNEHMTDAIEKVNQQGLTKAQEAAAQQRPQLRAAFEGDRIDASLKSAVDADPRLRGAGIATTPRFQFGPDVNGPAGSGVSWDSTTMKDFAAHVERYGTGVRPLLWLKITW